MIATAENPAPVKLLLTTEQACSAMSVCRRTLYDLTQPRGPIPVVRIGKSAIRYSVAALEKWITEQQAQGAAQ